MDKAIRNKNVSMSILTIAASGLLYFYSIGFNECWPLTWFAPLPILLYAQTYNKTKTFLVAFLSYLIGAMNIYYYFNTPLPITPLIIGGFLDALCFAIIILVSRWMTLRIHNFIAIFCFPTLWTAYEFLSANNPASGMFNSIAYSQTHFLELIQITSITGIFGITFLLCLLPSSFAVAYLLRKHRVNFLACLAIGLGTLSCTLIFGAQQLNKIDNIPRIDVAVLSSPTTPSQLHAMDTAHALPVINRYAAQITALKNQHIDVFLLPEKIVRVTPTYKNQAYEILAKAAKERNAVVIAGLSEFENDKKFNVALIFSNQGTLINTYYKQHMLPGPESGFTSGKNLTLFNIHNQLAGVAICKDMDFINPASQYSQANVGILFVPALDFFVDGWLHARIAILQGVANGYAVVRAAQWGLLTVSDSSGRIIANVPALEKYAVNLITNVKPGKGKTFYAKHRNWFGWTNIIAVILLLIFALLRFKK